MSLDDELAVLYGQMLQQLPSNIEEVRALVDAACALQSQHRHSALSLLEMSAHRLRGRAAMLHLEQLSSAAADLEHGAQAGKSEGPLRSMLAACLAAPSSAGARSLE